MEKEFKPYPDGGTLRANTYKTGPKSKDYWGEVAINLKDLTNIKVVDGLHVVKLSGWKRKDSTGKTYLSLAVDRYIPEQNPEPVKVQEEDDLDF